MSQKFKSDIEAQAGIRDSSGAIGTSGQVLSSTGSNVSWINQTTIASDVQNLVKAGVAINKGQAVYVTGADGTNIIVGLASNTSEATSSKTLGLLNATVAINGMADVVQIGRLSGLNTIGATAGDPVWLGTNGNLIYGLLNKPYAPAHLVFIGVVTRVNSNNGEIFINVQNGFELNEIHDVDLKTNVPINGDVLGYDGTLWVNKTIAEWLGYTPANASGTTNYVSKFTGTTTLGNSQIFDNGVGVGINTTSPNYTTAGRSVIDINGSYQSMLALSVGGVGKSFLFYTGTDLLISNESNGSIKINTNGSEKAIITSNGNVGIGTTSPAWKLDVSGLGRFRDANTYEGAFIEGTNGVAYFGSLATDAISLYSSGLSRVYINSSGNVGIGTTSPASLLDVSGASPVLTITRTSGSFTNTINFNSSASNFASIISNSGTGEQRYSIGPASGWGGFHTFYTDTTEKMRIASNGAIKFNSYGSGTFTGTATQRLAVDSSGNVIEIPIGGGAVDGSGTTNYVTKWTDADTIGNSVMYDNGTNVGIGTTSPSKKLTVIDNSTYQLRLASTNSAYSDAGIFMGSDISDPYYYGTIKWDQGAQAVKISSNSASGIGGITFETSPNTSAPTERMRITSSGNVGIGTTSPYYKTTISGNPRNTDVLCVASNQIDSDGTQSYVGISLQDQYADGGGNASAIRSYSNLYSQWGSTLTFSTTGTGGNGVYERMRITASGNVGIGTTNPLNKLTIQSDDVFNQDSSGQIVIKGSTSTTKSLRIGFDTTSNYGYVQSIDVGIISRPFVLQPFGGNVGIGTTSPSEKLEVQSGTSGAKIKVSNTGGGSASLEISSNASSVAQLNFTNQLSLIGGNVGIGTTSPSTLLHLFKGTYPVFQIESTSVLGNMGIDTSNNFLNIGTVTNHDLVLATNNSEKMRVASNGNVGIGTTSPNYKLQVVPLATYGNGEDGNISINTSPSGGTYSNTTVGGIVFGDQNITNNYAGRIAVVQNSPSTSTLTHMRFYTNSGGGNTATLERMRILGDGSVGIGTTTPGFATSGRTVLTLNGPTSALMEFQNGGVFKSYLFQGPGGFEIYDISNIQFAVNGGERMRVASNGNVGIGTSSPLFRFDVRSAGTGSQTFSAIFADSSASGNALGIANQNGVSSIYSTFIGGTATNCAIAFVPTTSAGGQTEAMRITSSGNVGIGTASPHASALLHLRSTARGFLPPVMRTGERDSISSPAAGLMIFNEDDEVIQVYTNGSGWRTLAFL